jgi:hypothetical protein
MDIRRDRRDEVPERKPSRSVPSTGSSALVSNTLICEASRLAKGSDHKPSSFYPKPFRLLDLFSTIEATVLYEHLCTLPAKLNVSGEQLALRDQLIAADVVFELDLAEDHERIARLIVEGLAQIKNPVAHAGSADGQPIDYAARVLSEILNFFNSDTDGLVQQSITAFKERNPNRPLTIDDMQHLLPPNIYDSVDRSASGGGGGEIFEASNFSEFGRTLMGWVDYHSSGAYEFCTSVLRDMYYIYAAECKQLPYWPQTTRVEFARNFPNYMEKGARTKLYSKFANDLEASVQQIREIFDRDIMFIPPFSALVLERSNFAQDIPDQILRIRHEFMWLRHDMQALDNEMREADTFGKMQRVAKKQKRLSETIAEQFGRKDSVWVERGLKYIPELAKPALSPSDPTKYGVALLLQPIEWLIDALRRRPVAMFFDAKRKVESISGYQSLVSKVFKADIVDTESLKWYFPAGPREEASGSA